MTDENLTELQQDLVQHAREIASEFSLTYWYEKDEAAEYPWEFVRAFADAGYLGIIIPPEYGGLGLGITEAALLLREIAASGAGTSGAAAVHFYVFPPAPIIHHGTDAMKSAFLPQMAKGELLMAFGVTEPNAGSDTSRTSTRAVRDGDRWLINGQKVWTTNAQNASHILLLTRTSPRDDERPFEGMTLFFVPLDRARCTIRLIKKLGRAAVDSNEVFIDNLEAQDADIVGEIGKGFYHLITGLNPERIVLAMEAIGMGIAALRLATEYAKERIVFNNPIGSYQAVAHPLADSWAHLQAAELMAMRAAALFDKGKHCGAEANAAKYLAADAGFQACDVALQTHGGFGYAKEYHIERLWRESRLYRLAPISQEMVLNYLSERVLGLPKSY
ncbi:MAG: acyl-CoA dehydrogenase [Candidatus Nanopelagicales bacterium]|nr:acyl-CoA dehydrogenase [Candidatus Nanopelagicales bacterium]